jgi:hypothetical protein
MVAKDRNLLVTGNTISTNGINNLVGQLSYGIYGGALYSAVVANNLVVNETYNDIMAIGRTNNVVTVQTASAVNYQVGWQVQVNGTPSAGFDGTFPVTQFIDGRTFTYSQTGPDLPVQHYQAGLAGLGQTLSVGGGFDQNIGIGSQDCNNSEIRSNTVRYNDYGNVTFVQFLPGQPYFNCLVVSDQNTMGVPSTLFSSANRDFYPISQTGTSTVTPLKPTAGGLVATVPSIENVGLACTTPAAPGATCTVTVVHNFGGDLGYLDMSNTTNRTTCTLDDTPTPQTGFPVILKTTQTSANQATVTIGTLTGIASGGGSLTCWTNFRY